MEVAADEPGPYHRDRREPRPTQEDQEPRADEPTRDKCSGRVARNHDDDETSQQTDHAWCERAERVGAIPGPRGRSVWREAKARADKWNDRCPRRYEERKEAPENQAERCASWQGRQGRDVVRFNWRRNAAFRS